MSVKSLFKIAAIVAAFFVIYLLQLQQTKALREKIAQEQRNTTALMSDIETYKVKDSLNAARIQSLELSLKDFERFRSEDADLIRQLKNRNAELKSINKAQEQTIISLSSIPKDTIIIVDSIPIRAKKVQCGDYWYSFEGILTDDRFEGTLENRDSILIAESVSYKRFLFWNTKRIKSRDVQAISMNPHTKIIGMEHIIIEK